MGRSRVRAICVAGAPRVGVADARGGAPLACGIVGRAAEGFASVVVETALGLELDGRDESASVDAAHGLVGKKVGLRRAGEGALSAGGALSVLVVLPGDRLRHSACATESAVEGPRPTVGGAAWSAAVVTEVSCLRPGVWTA